MRIEIPKRLNYSEFKAILRQQDQDAFDRAHTCEIDWRQTVWATLPELAGLLCLSARLIHVGKPVRWLLPDPRNPVRELQDLRFNAHAASEVQAALNAIRRDAFSRDGLFPRERRRRFNELHESIPANRRDSHLERWLTAEAAALEPLDLLGYLRRYNVFKRAGDIGVEFSPEPEALPKSVFAASGDSACLEFSPIHSLTDVDELVDQLCDPDQLARVLGDYASLDFARGGALSQILVAELGKNVGEHSDASAGWLCTRLVSPNNLDRHCENDPLLKPLLKKRVGFVEVVVCDNGCGIGSGLDKVLARDQRQSIKQKYSKLNGRFSEADIVDYAFDRLSSTKRDIAALVHFSKNGDSTVLASGLYWIWNVVRTYHGLVGIRTGGFNGWYDFTDSGPLARTNWTLPRISGETVPFRFPGTMIRLCLPLVDVTRVGAELPSIPTAPGNQGSTMQVRMSWVGDITRRTSVRHIRGKRKQAQTLPGFAEMPQFALLEELNRRHACVSDGDVLLFDLAGTHRLWDSQSVAPLCHFFVEMNYTSTSGRSAVVLWNVPHGDEALFEEAIAEAARRYHNVADFRRAALFVRDDGQTRLFCGWERAEKILGKLTGEGEHDLDEIGAGELESDDRERLERLITENAHLFSWTGKGRVKLRAWPSELRSDAWNQEILWLDGVIDSKVEDGGALRELDNAFYQLPTTGRLVKKFYSFGGMISNHEHCSRIAWLLNRVVSGIEQHKREKVKVIVSVTRPVMSLARHLTENYLDGRGVEHLRASTVEELERKGKQIESGNAIFVADVVSSGTLCEQVKRALPKLNWLGTAAILDTGDTTIDDTSYPTVIQDVYDFGITYRVTRNAATGDVFALASRNVEKHDPTEDQDKPVTAIDRVNVCPVKSAELDNPIWPYLSRRADALQVGHFHAGDLHHYIFYVNGERLIDAVHPKKEFTLRDDIVETIVTELENADYEPHRTVIIHPPRDTSYAEEIAIAVQRATGAAYRYVLHRELFAGHRRFSSFIDHGIPIADATVIVIDDGSNTGETLIGLLQAAAASAPKRVTAHIALSRMPLHKIDLLKRIRGLSGVSLTTRTRFAVTLSIPVFNPKTCPICQFRHSLAEIVEHSALLRRYANEIRDETASVETGSSSAEPPHPFYWSFRSATEVAHLREAIELADYHEKSHSQVIKSLKDARGDNSDESTIPDALVDLAFVISVEPNLLSTPIFIPFLQSLFRQTCSKLPLVTCQRELGTLLEFAFHLMFQLYVRQKKEPEESARALWRSVIPISLLDIPTLGRFLSACVAEVKHETGWERDEKLRVCCSLATQFTVELETLNRPHPDVNGAMGRLFAREVIAVLDGTLDDFHAVEGTVHSSLPDLASSASGKFFWHAVVHVLGSIQSLKQEPFEHPRMAGLVHSLLQAFDELYQLQYRICRVDSSATAESSGADVHWSSPLLASAIARFGESLTDLAEHVAANQPNNAAVRRSVNAIAQDWDDLCEQLQPAFESIFPVVLEVVDGVWSQCESMTGLPTSAVETLQKDPRIPDNTRCFISRTLFTRFLHVAMQNLRDRAFPTWSDAQKQNDAIVRIAVEQVQDADGIRAVCIKVIDNGPLYRTQDVSSDGQGKGLADVRQLVEPFGGRVEGPTEENGLTTVALFARIRE